MALTLVIGVLLLVALATMIVGPHFGEWLARRIHLSQVWLWAWPYIHWMLSVSFTVLAVEALYFLAPNLKQRFLATLPGALLSVSCWIGLSHPLGLYFRTFANFNKTYGTLGAGIALMVWLYWTGFAMLVGAEFERRTGEANQGSRNRTERGSPHINEAHCVILTQLKYWARVKFVISKAFRSGSSSASRTPSGRPASTTTQPPSSSQAIQVVSGQLKGATVRLRTTLPRRNPHVHSRWEPWVLATDGG